MPRSSLQSTIIPPYLNPFDPIANLLENIDNISLSNPVDLPANLKPASMPKSHPTELLSDPFSKSAEHLVDLDKQGSSNPSPLLSSSLVDTSGPCGNLSSMHTLGSAELADIQTLDPGDDNGDSEVESPRSDAWGCNDPSKLKAIRGRIKKSKCSFFILLDSKLKEERIDMKCNLIANQWMSIHNCSPTGTARLLVGWDPKVCTVVRSLLILRLFIAEFQF
ncbi:hypothetical protein NE237_020671 [Protea cynaroides]|uniref:Uncharacterized protein n=1 Tax=Protea cynaroides TaxID=273540 RepID=A0A9Q0H8V3_9MAGN|nr:hypothetical protein NE237_020671 [Protea cynaroides]